MPSLDRHEVQIARELIRNPRISDNGIAKKTKVPVMTVNRKRKALEENGVINYYADLNHGSGGTEDFFAKQMYIIKFKIGITRQNFIDKIRNDKSLKKSNAEHIVISYLGEKDGHLSNIFLLTARSEPELNEVFNGEIVPMFRRNFGEDGIISIDTVKILEPIRKNHNYIFGVNLEKGKIKDDWPDDYIFVDRESFNSNK